jgi:ATP-dependent Clp protease ATP-binding subunit ClpC
VGANLIKREATMGFVTANSPENDYQAMKQRVTEELKKAFRPEFLNRIDELIVFHSLDEQHMREIAELMLNGLTKRLAEQELKLEVTSEVKALISREGFDVLYGARPLRRAIQRLIEDPLAEEMLKGRFKSGATVHVSVEENGIVFN